MPDVETHWSVFPSLLHLYIRHVALNQVIYVLHFRFNLYEVPPM